MNGTALLVLILAILAAGCFLLASIGVPVAKPALTPLGLFLLTLAGIALIWP